MTLIGTYTNKILIEFLEFKFDAREKSDLSKAISQHLSDFEEDVKQRSKSTISLHNLRNLNSGIWGRDRWGGE